MTSAMLVEETKEAAPSLSAAPKTDTFERPPTKFGRECSLPLAREGYHLANTALRYALEDVPTATAVDALLSESPSPEALRLAFDYLAFKRFDVPVNAQASALFVIEDAMTERDRRSQRVGVPLGAGLRQVLARLPKFREHKPATA